MTHTATAAQTRPAFVVLDVETRTTFAQDWDGQPFDAEGALAFMSGHNRRVGSDRYVLIHGWTQKGRGQIIDGADWRACDLCGQGRNALVHTLAAA